MRKPGALNIRLNIRRKGSTVAELPVVIGVALISMVFPVVSLVALSFRGAFLYSAVRSACADASRSSSFSDAARLAGTDITSNCAAMSGVILKDYKVSIVEKDRSSKVETEYLSPLAPDSIDTRKNSYFIRVCADASIDPLVKLNLLGNVPGLTDPYNIAVSAQLFAEQPEGLSH